MVRARDSRGDGGDLRSRWSCCQGCKSLRRCCGSSRFAIDPQAAKEAARLRQQYDAPLAIMVAGLVAVAYGLTAGFDDPARSVRPSARGPSNQGEGGKVEDT